MKEVKKMKGAIAPIITVFKEDESIDEERTIDHVKWLLDNGIQGLVICGSTGESISMTLEERKRIAKLIIDEFRNNVRRHFYPSCHAKRVVEFGEWLCSNVLKNVPHRHFVFSIPKIIRIYFLLDRKLLADLARIAWDVLSLYYKNAVNKNNIISAAAASI